MSEATDASGSGQDPSGRVPHLIGGKDPALGAQLAEVLSADPEVEVVRELGSRNAPSLFVVETSPVHAEELRELLGPQVTIERDLPLNPLERGPDIRHPQEGTSP
ncbi:hypothetical protein [Nonomuraea sp. SBT364]|uniref:hypothetical protein n=1 Tax=Nonomuraea sp. SBT364 TaxID=1580530 RepID=UPI0012E19FDC|nr:hypothetical protein [Nonomuraea sp. SBT364]